MDLNNYLVILFEGMKNKNFFSDYLFREYKKAEDNNFSKEEFINGLEKANNFILEKINFQKYQDLRDLNSYFIQKLEAGRVIEDKKEMINEFNLRTYTINPAHFGLNKYAGFFHSINEVEFYKHKIEELNNKLNNENIVENNNLRLDPLSFEFDLDKIITRTLAIKRERTDKELKEMYSKGCKGGYFTYTKKEYFEQIPKHHFGTLENREKRFEAEKSGKYFLEMYPSLENYKESFLIEFIEVDFSNKKVISKLYNQNLESYLTGKDKLITEKHFINSELENYKKYIDYKNIEGELRIEKIKQYGIFLNEMLENYYNRLSNDYKDQNLKKTPNILNEDLDILYDRLKEKTIISCKKTKYNKLFNGTQINTFEIEWIGSIGLLKSLFTELNKLYKFESPLYFKNCFQFTAKQYNNNKISKKDMLITKELLS